MIRILILVLCLVSSPISAETGTADPASGKRLAGELQVCNAYFMSVSVCFADKTFSRKLGSKGPELSHIYLVQATRAGKNAFEAAKASGMTPADLTAILMNTAGDMQGEIAGDCNKIEKLIDKWAASCKQLVENPGLRLKKLSECTNEGKVGC